jgi:hypothetical protein
MYAELRSAIIPPARINFFRKGGVYDNLYVTNKSLFMDSKLFFISGLIPIIAAILLSRLSIEKRNRFFTNDMTYYGALILLTVAGLYLLAFPAIGYLLRGAFGD